MAQTKNGIDRRSFMGGSLAVLGTSLISWSPGTHTTGKRVIIIGFDGMDPILLSRFRAKGIMPNFDKLLTKTASDFKPLISSVPPQSPVAWSNFITGSNPGKHGIYDFIHRNPDTYMPYLSTSEASEGDMDDSLLLGSRVLWLKGGTAKLLRRGTPFWEYMAREGIYTRLFKVPSNFPPWVGEGWSSSGLGTPDVLGTYGTFTFFTDNPPDLEEEIGGGTIVPVNPFNNVISTQFTGPVNAFKVDEERPFHGSGENRKYNHPDTTVPLSIYIDKDHPQIKIEYQDQEIMLAEGEWSGWYPIVFKMWPGLVEAKGIVRFYLKQARPDFMLYASPINMDPKEPSIPVSHPPEYAAELAEELGYYYTQGMPEDTKARQADLGIFDDGELFHQMMLVYEEDLRMLRYHLDRFKDGLLFYYFSTLDQGTHMFWRLHDPSHPAHDAEWAKKLGDPVETLYRKMDHALGMVLPEVDENTTLFIISDHGFASWERSFQVNTWLLQNEYLRLVEGADQEKVKYFRDESFRHAVDWSRTSAYGLGINGVYINVAEREKYGAVPPSRKKALVDEIARGLMEYVDPETGVKPVLVAYKAYEVYHGDYTGIAPDIVLGFKRGYRGGDDSALGKFPADIFSVNTSSWSGDHCIAECEVPGVVLTNRKILKNDPALIDLGPTVLSIFGIPVPADMDGKPIF